MNMTAKTIALAALMLIGGQSAAIAAIQADTLKTDTVSHKTDSVKVEKQAENLRHMFISMSKDIN